METRRSSALLPAWFWVAWTLLLSFRLISLPLLMAAVSLKGRPWTRRVAWCLFVLSAFSPVDISVGGFPGRYRGGGVHPSGPRLVPYIVGMPATTRLIARYGEFYSGGCSGISPSSPRWIFVLY
jgi:hypothetical protein